MNCNRRASKNRCFWTVVLVKILESPLDSKEIKPVILKGNQPCILIERTDAEAETPIHWPPNGNTVSLGKSLMLGKIEGRRGWQDEMIGWHRTMQWTWIWANSGKWDREAWLVAVRGVTKSWTWLSDWTTTTCFMTSQKQQLWTPQGEIHIRMAWLRTIPTLSWKWIEFVVNVEQGDVFECLGNYVLCKHNLLYKVKLFTI